MGTAIALGDGTTFAYLKDIVVHPERQGRGIGTRIVEGLLAIIRRSRPDGMIVTLFTAQHLAEFLRTVRLCRPRKALWHEVLRSIERAFSILSGHANTDERAEENGEWLLGLPGRLSPFPMRGARDPDADQPPPQRRSGETEYGCSCATRGREKSPGMPPPCRRTSHSGHCLAGPPAPPRRLSRSRLWCRFGYVVLGVKRTSGREDDRVGRGIVRGGLEGRPPAGGRRNWAWSRESRGCSARSPIPLPRRTSSRCRTIFVSLLDSSRTSVIVGGIASGSLTTSIC